MLESSLDREDIVCPSETFCAKSGSTDTVAYFNVCMSRWSAAVLSRFREYSK